MASSLLYEALDSLAERYIPSGKHKYLHVDAREMWVDLMTSLLDKGYIPAKLTVLKKYAVNWETLLVHKLSIQN